MRSRGRFRALAAAAILLTLNPSGVRAQDHTVMFSTSDPGVSKAITNWGLDTTWNSIDNMRRGLIFMGSNNVNVVRVAFLADEPLTNNDISPAQKANLQSMANTAALAGPNAKWNLSSGTGAGVNSWYQSGAGRIYPDRWAALMTASKRAYNRTMWMVEPFNEPDYGWGQGSVADLYNILGYLQADTNFTGTALAGASTLNDDNAIPWYDQIKSRTAMGTTHQLAGSFNSYVNFFQDVIASGDVAVNPEVHDLVEVLAGAEYGLNTAIWWGTAELARGSFVKANQGQRLAYVVDRARWTAAAVYRGTNGAVQAFLGASERQGQTTTYRFFSRDRDVFYNGDGPRRDYTVSIPADQEKLVNITWGADVPPAISGGRYIVVNRNSGKVMEVASSGTGDGANIQQNTYSGGSNQQWDIFPFTNNVYLDQSYYSMTAVHSGKPADVNNWSYNDGANVQQWTGTGGENQQWFFEYAGDGYFYIRSRWSGKNLEVSGSSVANGANIWQWSGANGLNQRWRLVPIGSAVEFIPPAAPTLVTASANAASVQLNWQTNSEPDLASYTVLRGTNSGGPYEIVACGLTNNWFVDNSANQWRAYFYVVKAVDRSLNRSPNSAQVSAAPTGGPALIARYAFDGNFADSSENANHASPIGSPIFVAGKFGNAIDFSGTDQYAMLPAGLMASVTNFTIALWVNWDGGSAWQRIFDFGNDTTQYMFLSPSSGSGTLRFAISTNGYAPGAEQILETSPLPAGQWRHVAITRNGNSASLYTNGVLAVSGVVTIPSASFNPVLNNLGASQYPDPRFNGRLDEMFIYNYALTATEITRLMNNQPPALNSTNLSVSASGNALTFSWPDDHLGWRLQVQTNGLGTNWFDVAGSRLTNTMTLPTDGSIESVFYRLIYP